MEIGAAIVINAEISQFNIRIFPAAMDVRWFLRASLFVFCMDAVSNLFVNFFFWRLSGAEGFSEDFCSTKLNVLVYSQLKLMCLLRVPKV